MCPQTVEGTVEERLQRAIALKIEGRYEEAERDLRGLLECAPESAQVHRELGLVLGFTGFFDESVEALERSVALDPQYLEARNDLSLTYAMLGDVDKARAGFEAVLEIDPANAVALRNIVYFRSDDM